ncbi:transposase [Pseudolysobacter antarcticus]|uniref:transposase n=1 Tax=Pseudolysobacter antarcticus TaxID=2511995 RepID=UPI001A926A2B|nr:transposase [Pseudolysobacter antarcticus]
MSRPLRIEFSGALYHVMARGNAREDIFRNDADREHFLASLGRACARFDWQVWAYYLMDNHYHLLVETRRATLSRGMREVNGIYTQAFNRRHGRVGHVLQGRYKSVLIDKDAYLQEVSRYIVLNPVRACLCANAGDWEWSSYRAVMGKAPAEDWLAVADTLATFGYMPGPARIAYA